MKWVEVVIKTVPENEDLISDILYQAGAAGLAIEDPQDFIDLKNKREDWDFIDSSLMNFDKDIIGIKAYFNESDEINKIIDFIKDKVINIPKSNGFEAYGELVLNSVDDEDFAEAWKKYYKPLKIGDKIVIKPTWEEYEEQSGDMVIELDPGMAFGTGTHETTFMCAEALESFVQPGDYVYDIGCGSGILGIVAAKLGADKVVGIDIDPICIDVSKENIKINNVEDKVGVFLGDLFDVVNDQVDLIVSNIIAEIIAGMVADLNKYLKDNGIFIASGIILSKVELVESALINGGFKLIETKKMGEWACIIAQK